MVANGPRDDFAGDRFRHPGWDRVRRVLHHGEHLASQCGFRGPVHRFDVQSQSHGGDFDAVFGVGESVGTPDCDQSPVDSSVHRGQLDRPSDRERSLSNRVGQHRFGGLGADRVGIVVDRQCLPGPSVAARESPATNVGLNRDADGGCGRVGSIAARGGWASHGTIGRRGRLAALTVGRSNLCNGVWYGLRGLQHIDAFHDETRDVGIHGDVDQRRFGDDCFGGHRRGSDGMGAVDRRFAADVAIDDLCWRVQFHGVRRDFDGVEGFARRGGSLDQCVASGDGQPGRSDPIRRAGHATVGDWNFADDGRFADFGEQEEAQVDRRSLTSFPRKLPVNISFRITDTHVKSLRARTDRMTGPTSSGDTKPT